jgi:hypothetical protein
VRDESVEVAWAAKRYERDRGVLPERIEDLVPHYLPRREHRVKVWKGEVFEHTKWATRFVIASSPATRGGG